MTQQLTEKQRQTIANHYQFAGKNQTETAQAFGVSRRTVQRILLEHGLIKPTDRVSKDKKAMLEVIQKHRIEDADTLDKALGMIPMTPHNVTRHLIGLPPEQLMTLFYNVMRQQTINDIHANARRQAAAEQQAQPAANGEMRQEALV